MTTTYWNPNAQYVAQSVTITVTAVVTGGTLTVTINSKSITYTCLSTDTTNSAAIGLAALLNSRTAPPEFQAISWSASSTVITGSADVPGTPFTLTKSQAGGATCNLATAQVNVSPNDVNNPSNWLRNGSASVPQNGDDVIVANSAFSLLWNLSSLAGVLFNSFTRYQSFTGRIGLPSSNPLGYIEYQPTYFQFGSNVPLLPIVCGVGAGNGPTLERYNTGTYNASLTALAAGNASDTYSIRFLGSGNNNQINTNGVSVAVAMLPGETASLAIGNSNTGGALDCGVGCSFTGTGGAGTLTLTGGNSTLFCAPMSIIARNNANLTLSANNGVFSNVSAINGVAVAIKCPMTITALTLQKSSKVNAENAYGTVTITNTTIDGDTCQINDPNNVIAYTNAASVAGQVSTGPFLFTGPRTDKIT